MKNSTTKNTNIKKMKNYWGNLKVVRTTNGILLVDPKHPENKRFFLYDKKERQANKAANKAKSQKAKKVGA